MLRYEVLGKIFRFNFQIHMSFKTASGTSTNFNNPKLAGKEAIEKAMSFLEGEVKMVMVFSSTVFDYSEVLSGIKEVIGEAPVIGCSSAGVITDDGVHEETLAVLVAVGDSINFTPIKVEGIGKDMNTAGVKFGEAVRSAGDAKLAFIFSDALSGNGTSLVRGALSVLGGNFPLVGGAASDDMQFKKTVQFFNDEVLTDSAVGYAVSGEVRFAVGADHGWQPIGNTRTVTKATGTTVFELDGKPAFEIYQDYFGERASDFKKTLSLAAVSYPLGMKDDGADTYMIRVPLAVNEDGSIVCGAEVIEGSTISLMIGTTSSAMGAAKATTQRLSDATKDVTPRMVFISNCVARKVLYGEKLKEEIETVKQLVGLDTTIFGFYSYGQIAPLKHEVKNVATCDPGFYEQSISVTMLGE
jgi:hypothetical protein